MYQTKFFVQANTYQIQLEVDSWIAVQLKQRPASFEIVSTSYAIDPATHAEKVFIIYK